MTMTPLEALERIADLLGEYLEARGTKPLHEQTEQRVISFDMGDPIGLILQAHTHAVLQASFVRRDLGPWAPPRYAVRKPT